jgi:hypothetical protein
MSKESIGTLETERGARPWTRPLRWLGVITVVVALSFCLPSKATAAALRSAVTMQAESQQEQQERDREREQERLEREQEKREREQEAREREQEREQERAERLSELYDDGREALDEDHYEKAAQKFAQLAEMNGPQTDAALYWKAYAENKLGKKDSALGSIAELKRRYPQSRWKKDAEALEIETRQSTGQKPNPEVQSDEDLKMLALQGVMNSDPERGAQILEARLNGNASPKEKSKALFVLAQSGTPKAMEILGRVARGESNPDLQRKAVQYLAMFGGKQSQKTLNDVYASATDESVKRAVLRSYMLSGDRASLLAAAKNEKNDSLKREAIRQLGLTGGESELQQLYQQDTSPEIRRELLQAFFLAGDSSKLLQVAQSEKDPELRRAAIRNLGLMGSGRAGDALQEIYNKETDRGIKEEILNAYFIQGNAKGLIAIARAEKDPSLKKRAVEKLSLMGSKEATDYLMELLK